MKKKLRYGFLFFCFLLFFPAFTMPLSSDIPQPDAATEASAADAAAAEASPALDSAAAQGETAEKSGTEKATPSDSALPDKNPPTPSPVSEPPEQPKEMISLPSSVGTLTYYNQSDPRWAHSIYGGTDTISAYGCGPTVLAMLVTSFTDQNMPPDAMAQWAAANHYWSPASGSAHSLIPEGAAAFGLRAESFQNLTPEGVKAALRKGTILVALMGAGHFTSNGHFIIISSYWSGNQVRVADPASLEHTQVPWDIDLILNELSGSHTFGGPVWAISPQ